MILKSIFHLLNIANYVGIIYYMAGVTIPGRHSEFGGQWKFLTYWNLWFQLIYFTTALINNFIGSEATLRSKSTKTQKARDYVFSSVAFPLGLFVSAVFWLIFAYDRELIFSVKLDKYYPPVTNHMMHTVPAFGQVVELLMSYHIYPNRFAGMATFGLLSMIYLVWICIIAYYGGFWVYPIFKVMSPVGRAGFITLCCAMAAVLYIIGEILNSLVWSKYAFLNTRSSKKSNTAAEPVQHRYATRSRTKVEKTN